MNEQMTPAPQTAQSAWIEAHLDNDFTPDWVAKNVVGRLVQIAKEIRELPAQLDENKKEVGEWTPNWKNRITCLQAEANIQRILLKHYDDLTVHNPMTEIFEKMSIEQITLLLSSALSPEEMRPLEQGKMEKVEGNTFWEARPRHLNTINRNHWAVEQRRLAGYTAAMEKRAKEKEAKEKKSDAESSA